MTTTERSVYEAMIGDIDKTYQEYLSQGVYLATNIWLFLSNWRSFCGGPDDKSPATYGVHT